MNKNVKKILLMSVVATIWNVYSVAYSQESPIVAPQPVITQQSIAGQQVQTTEQPQIMQMPTEEVKIPNEIVLNIEQCQKPISLEESLRVALEKNLNIQIIGAQKDQSKWLYYNSASEFLPDVNYDYNLRRLSGQTLFGGVVPLSLNRTVIDTGFNAEWIGFSGFRRVFNLQDRKAIYKASIKNLELTKDSVLLETTQNYYRLLQDKINIEILKQALLQTEEQLKINKQRFNAGVGTKFDVIRSDSEVANARQNLISAYNRLKFSQARLANTIGIDVFTPLMPVQETADPANLLKNCVDLKTITDIALKNKPDLDIAQLNIAAVRSRRNSAYSIYSPNVGIRANVNWSGTTDSDLLKGNTLTMFVNWRGGENLGLAGLTNVKALNAQVKEAQLVYQNTTRNLEQNLITAYYDLIAAKALIEATQKEADAATESVRLATLRLESGVGVFIDVIQAQTNQTQARIKNINSIINYNLAQSNLLFQMGVISPSNLLEGYEVQNNG